MTRISVVRPASRIERVMAFQSMRPRSFAGRGKAVASENGLAGWAHDIIPQFPGCVRVPGPAQNHAALFNSGISRERNFPVTALVLQARGHGQTQADDPAVRRAALDDLGGLG